MKKKIISVLAAASLLILAACAPGTVGPGGGTDEEQKSVELSLWTYPVGGLGDVTTVSSLLTSFHQTHPDIRLSIRTIDYLTGDSEVEKAIKEGEAPDLILEGPERLVANWAARDLMVDLNDLWEGEDASKVYTNVREACHDSAGDYYIYPVCMTTHCMAINRDLFREAGAMQYIDEENHTWTTEGFVKAVEALHAHGMEEVAAIYCGGQGGDQGTRALVTNLYGGSFTDKAHQNYTVNSPENIKALQLLKDTEGIVFASDLVGTDEIEKFCKKELAMSFCWNVAVEISQTISGNLDFDVFPMTFPTSEGDPALQGGIWGFGIFDNGDEARIEAAKTFIRYMTAGTIYSRLVLASTYWPVIELPDLYVNDKLMDSYSIFQRYLGDYYQVTRGWADARTAWWNMLQRIGKGEEVEKAVKEFSDQVNGE